MEKPDRFWSGLFRNQIDFHDAPYQIQLRRWNLNIGNNVRVAAFCVTGIHGSGCVTVIRSVSDCGIGIGRSGIQRGTVDLRVGAAGAGVNCTINVVSRNIR